MAIRFRYEDIDLGKPLEGLIYEKRDQIAYITINRPDKGNSLTKKMEQIFRAIWTDVREDPERVARAQPHAEGDGQQQRDRGILDERRHRGCDARECCDRSLRQRHVRRPASA